tara:strand:+ start:1262 stop:1603 length:342 start_codon:yes stop_codon:yes gene_type:complete
MSRFGDLLKTNEVHSAFEEETVVETTPVAPPPRPEEVVEDIFAPPIEPSVVIDDFINPLDSMPVSTDNRHPNFKKMDKVELEEFGRTVGIELDRRLSQKKLVKQLKEHMQKTG